MLKLAKGGGRAEVINNHAHINSKQDVCSHCFRSWFSRLSTNSRPAAEQKGVASFGALQKKKNI